MMDRPEKVRVVAEMSGNHEKDFQKACGLVYAAKTSGADAVKIQLYSPDEMTLKCDNEFFYMKAGLWAGSSLYDLYEQCQLPREWVPKLKELAQSQGLQFIASVFGPQSLAWAKEYGITTLKIASFESADVPFVQQVVAQAEEVIMSTGAITYSELYKSGFLLRHSRKPYCILHCCPQYPAMPDKANLRTIMEISRTYQGNVGISDHTRGIGISIAAAALGVKMVEKHLSLDGRGPDRLFSLKPEMFRIMVKGIRDVEVGMGSVIFGGDTKYRRSVFACENIRKGEKFTPQNIRSVRAVKTEGTPPANIESLYGKEAASNYGFGQPIKQ